MSTPRLYDHACVIYNVMLAQATQYDDQTLFEGNTTDLLKEAGISNNYYSPIFRYLRGGGYITQIRRGGGGVPSQYALNGMPVAENYTKDIRLSGASSNPGDKAFAEVMKVSTTVVELAENYDAHTRAIIAMQTSLIKILKILEKAGVDISDISVDYEGLM